MNWFREFSTAEWVLVIGFLGLYLLFIGRNLVIANSIKVNTASVLIKLVVRSLMFACLLIALLGPLFGNAQREVKSIGRDVFICVDLSESMNAVDVAPSRLARLKVSLRQIISSLQGDRIGLIIFSSEAFMQCPLTFDQSALQLFIETLSTDLLPTSGTDFGPPLQLAVDKLFKGEEPGSKKVSSKVVLLISDGEDFGTETDKTLEELKEKGVKLLTLGIGSEEGSKIPTTRGYKTDREGNPVITKLERSSLVTLASTTGGTYFEINNTRNDAQALVNTIKRFDGVVKGSKVMDVRANKYLYPLVLALFLALVDLLIKIRVIHL